MKKSLEEINRERNNGLCGQNNRIIERMKYETKEKAERMKKERKHRRGKCKLLKRTEKNKKTK